MTKCSLRYCENNEVEVRHPSTQDPDPQGKNFILIAYTAPLMGKYAQNAEHRDRGQPKMAVFTFSRRKKIEFLFFHFY